MIVFFDFYEIALNKGKSIGIYNYAYAVLKNLAKKSSKDFTIVVACSEENFSSINDINGIILKVISPNFPTLSQRLFWRFYKAIAFSKKINADIYYSPKGFSPGFFKRKKKPFIVVTIHDLIPFFYIENYPNYFSKFENHFITKSLKHSLKIANNVITISDFSKKMIEKHEKSNINIHVIYNGVEIEKKLLQKTKEKKSYIFAITSMLPHKNKINLINGYIEYVKVSKSPLHLIVCGISNDQLNIPKEFIKYIECIPFADQARFSNLFSNATLFLFLPFIEGFGFPPLESLMYGVPTIVSDIPVLKEILGESACFVNHESPIEIANGIITVLSDRKIVNNILSSGRITTLKYTWENCTNNILKIFYETLN